MDLRHNTFILFVSETEFNTLEDVLDLNLLSTTISVYLMDFSSVFACLHAGPHSHIYLTILPTFPKHISALDFFLKIPAVPPCSSLVSIYAMKNSFWSSFSS